MAIDLMVSQVKTILTRLIGDAGSLVLLENLRLYNIQNLTKSDIETRKKLADNLLETVLLKVLSTQKLMVYKSELYSVLGLSEIASNKSELDRFVWN